MESEVKTKSFFVIFFTVTSGYFISPFWACLVEGFNTLVSINGLNLRTNELIQAAGRGLGSNPHGGNLVFKPLSGSYQLRTLHCRATLICASFGELMICYHFSPSVSLLNVISSHDQNQQHRG